MHLHPSVPKAGHLFTPRMSPEKKALCAMVDWAVREARGVVAGGEVNDPARKREVQENARTWFRERSMDSFGWGWTINALNLPEGVARRIEDQALAAPKTRSPKDRWGSRTPGVVTRGPLTDAEWERVEPLLPRPHRVRACRRSVVNALLLKSQLGRGIPLPPGYPDWRLTAAYRFRWRQNGTWDRLKQVLPLDD